MNSKRLAGVALTLAVVVVAACSSKQTVGTGVDVNVKGAYNRLGATSTTAAGAATAVTQPSGHLGIGASPSTTQVALTVRPATTAVRAVVTTQAPPTIALDIAIHGDTGTSTTQFDPSAARVYVGSLVRWTNRDTVARSVVADTGAFSSGMVAPGATFVYKAGTVGSFNYHDGTRPYAVGTLDVIAK